jgi:hypothetical protein
MPFIVKPAIGPCERVSAVRCKNGVFMAPANSSCLTAIVVPSGGFQRTVQRSL